ncbi:MAG TPA: acetyl-CoA hydrolase/transferase C-terminal domain-containing protein [Myxococcota bacterium]|nr:acetyl-CoA hydrolase/transferase C-terminal domain-containing protein [Myxococcota bacterium]
MARLRLDVDPKLELDRKLMSAERAAALVASGDLIWIPSTHAPISILLALAARKGELRGVKLRSTLIPDFGWFGADAMESFEVQIQYSVQPDARAALAARTIDFHPLSMIMQHKAVDAGRPEAQPIDELFLTVSPPDEHGWLCVGNACWDSVTAARRARLVIAEMNESVVRTCGDTWLHVSQFDALVRNNRPRLVAPIPTSYSPVDHAIAANVKGLIQDGSTIQIGLGHHTGALGPLGVFDERNDLSYFGELTTPGLVALARRGVINGRRAALHPGKFVAAHIGNSLEDLDYIERNPAFELHSYEHTNEPRNIAAHDDMIAMNGALMVDLTGQIGVYAFGPQVYTGLGGHLGFAMGAYLAKRGRYVTVLPSTAKGGTVSTIVPQFAQGQIVSIPREIADTIVTDQGVATLLGKSVRERAQAIVEIAHPAFREQLRFEAKRLYWP